MPDCWWWDGVTMLNTFVLALAYVILRAYDCKTTLIMLSLVLIQVSFLVIDILASPYASREINLVKQLSSLSIVGLFIGEVAVTQSQTGPLGAIACVFGIAPHVCFYVALLRVANKLIYVKNNKYRKVIAIGMIYFDINYKTQSYLHPNIEPATNRHLFDD
jgi:uncharacterized membrane protein